eukprot:3272141-Alexandrium_andersonii.AAC.1
MGEVDEAVARWLVLYAESELRGAWTLEARHQAEDAFRQQCADARNALRAQARVPGSVWEDRRAFPLYYSFAAGDGAHY